MYLNLICILDTIKIYQVYRPTLRNHRTFEKCYYSKDSVHQLQKICMVVSSRHLASLNFRNNCELYLHRLLCLILSISSDLSVGGAALSFGWLQFRGGRLTVGRAHIRAWPGTARHTWPIAQYEVLPGGSRAAATCSHRRPSPTATTTRWKLRASRDGGDPRE